jgi:hypothetical protein
MFAIPRLTILIRQNMYILIMVKIILIKMSFELNDLALRTRIP